jgi:hypothetical protein
MPIHLHIPMSPFNGTEQQYKAHLNVQQCAMIGYQTYQDTMSIFGLFSIKKNKAHKQAIKNYHESIEAYYHIMKENES